RSSRAHIQTRELLEFNSSHSSCQSKENDMNNFAIHIPASDLRTFVARALIALCLGALVGAERQWRQRNAGLRTNALVALGACLFELLSVLMLTGHSADPSRIAAYVISGIGFLGAGVIFRGGS